MSKVLSKIGAVLGMRRREANVLVVGLDHAGKSSLLNRLKPDEIRATEVSPTVGFQLERLQTKQMTFNMVDMCGQGMSFLFVFMQSLMQCVIGTSGSNILLACTR